MKPTRIKSLERGTIELTPQQIDEWRLRRDTEALARGEKLASVGSSLNPNQAMDCGHRVARRNGI